MYKHFVCAECGYVYREEAGERELKIKPETKFVDLPDTFECPVCALDKDVFFESFYGGKI